MRLRGTERFRGSETSSWNARDKKAKRGEENINQRSRDSETNSWSGRDKEAKIGKENVNQRQRVAERET